MASQVETSQSANTSRAATPALLPSSKKGFDSKKCDPCRKSKKGCDGNAPCERCDARGTPEQCTRLWRRGRAAGEKEVPEPKRQEEREDNSGDDRNSDTGNTNKTRQSQAMADAADSEALALAATNEDSNSDSVSTAPDSDDDDDSIDSGDELPAGAGVDTAAGVKTRRAQAKANVAAELAAYAASREQNTLEKPTFKFKMPAVLAKWDHDKCDRCREQKGLVCDGKKPCSNCTKRKRTCSREKGEAGFEEKRALAEKHGRWKWERKIKDRRIKHVEKQEREREKQMEERQKVEFELSKAQDAQRKAKGAKHKAVKEMRDAERRFKELMKRREDEEGGAEVARERQGRESTQVAGDKNSEGGEDAEDDDDDDDMKDVEGAPGDEGYQTQASPDLGEGDQTADDEETADDDMEELL